MKIAEYVSQDGLGLADLIRQRQVSREEVVAAAIEVAQLQNPKINAICHEAYDDALERARAKDADRGSAGPFDGVPFLLKDLGCELEGWPQRMGCRFFADNVARHTATLTQRYLDAGVVPIGKSTTPEFGMIAVTESELYGDTRNPWNLDHTPGASSGGSAAAVAAGVVPLAHANDGGGSIRIPASCSGLVGMKPSRGRTPNGPVLGDLAGGLGHQHVVARTVRDCAAMLDATRGAEPGDIYAAPEPASAYRLEVDRAPEPLRVAFWTRFWDDDRPIHSECVQAVRDAAKLLGELGHTVEEARPQIDYAALSRAFGTVWVSMAAALVETVEEKLGQVPEGAFEPYVLAFAEAGRRASSGALNRARDTVFSVGRPIARFHDDYDISVTTVLGTPPLKIGEWDRSSGRLFDQQGPAADFMLCSPIANATGQPSITLPLHQTADELPVGVMFTAAYGREDLLYRLAGQLERAAPWSRRTPPIWPCARHGLPATGTPGHLT